MKSVVMILFLFVSCMAVFVNCSPLPDTEIIIKSTDIVSGRQVAGQPVPPTTIDNNDDDDDDDDDEVGLGGALDLDDDDDDDSDDDDDDDDDDGDDNETGDDDDEDDDEDAFERFIEDILGGDEDDDDDDDETSPAVESPVQPASPIQPLQTPVVPAAVQSDLNTAAEDSGNIADNTLDSAPQLADTTGAVYDEFDEATDVLPEGQAATSVDTDNSHVNAVNVHQAPSNIITPTIGNQGISEDDDDDDDDDDDEDISEFSITEVGDDDDDEDDDEEDDDDDDDDDGDDDDLSDLARNARGFNGETPGHVSAIYVSKYNKFTDEVLGEINHILRTKYDPVTVKLSNPNVNRKANKNKLKKKKKNNNNNVKITSGRRNNATSNHIVASYSQAAHELLNRMERKPVSMGSISSVDTNDTTVINSRGTSDDIRNKTKKIITNENKIKNKTSTKVSTKKNKLKQSKPKPKSRARATLYGLSTLKRSGDVSVNMMSNHTTIRTKFNLGPLILKVEKEFGRASKKELRSATATTAEMSGKLSLRVLHGGAATLHSIRVLQPKQVRVDSQDDHDRTREFVWRRSSHIAHVVSQELSSATRSMLRPPPPPSPTKISST